MICMNKHCAVMLIMFAVTACSSGGSSDPAPKQPPTLTKSLVSGSALDLVNGKIELFDFQSGAKGKLLSSGALDSSGNYSIYVTSPDTLLLVKITEGIYFEEATSQQVNLSNTKGHQLTAVIEYTSGEPLTVHTTFLTTLAHGLAEYYVSSNQLTPTNAVIQANTIIDNWVGFPVRTTTPTHISAATPLIPIPDIYKYGFVAAALSELTYRESIASGLSNHSDLPSIEFIQLAYTDVKFDGVLNGVSDNGQITFGGLTVDANTYRELLSIRLMQFTSNIYNNSALVFDDLKPFASRLNTVTGALFSDTIAPDITTIKPDITNLVPVKDAVIDNTYPVSATTTDVFGVTKIEYFIGTKSVASPINMTNPSFTMAVPTTLTEGNYSLKIVATNKMGNSREIIHPFTVKFTFPKINFNDFLPGEGETVTGSVSARIIVTDNYGLLKSVEYYVDFVSGNMPPDLPVAKAGSGSAPFYVRLIDTRNFTNRVHTFEVRATNSVGKTTSVIHNVTVLN